MNLEHIKTTRQVAKMLGCTARNVTLLVEKKKLNPIKILDNGAFLFNTKDVEFFISKNVKP